MCRTVKTVLIAWTRYMLKSNQFRYLKHFNYQLTTEPPGLHSACRSQSRM